MIASARWTQLRRLGRWGLRRAATLWIVVTAAFLCAYALPGDPARIILGPQASATSVTMFRTQHGLDAPLRAQYVRFIVGLARLDLGESFAQRRSVRVLITSHLVPTLRLSFGALFLVVLGGLAVPIFLRVGGQGRLLALWRGVLLYAAVTPPYLLGLGALWLVSVHLHWVPLLFLPGRLSSWVLPCAVLSAWPTAMVASVFDENLESALRSPYVLSAHTFGKSSWHLVLVESLPNALPASAGAISNAIAALAAGTLFVENVFGIPGIGRLVLESARARDLAVLLPVCALLAFAVSLSAALGDLLLRWRATGDTA